MSFPYRTHPVHRFPWLQLAQGYTALAAYLLTEVREGVPLVAIDGFSGIRWAPFIEALCQALRADNLEPLLIDAETCLLPEGEIEQLLRPFLTNDPVFGRLYHGHLDELWDETAATAARRRIAEAKAELVIVYGCGAARLAPDGPVIYVDVPKDAGQALAGDGEVFPLGRRHREPFNLTYKRLYFVDWPVLNREKRRLLPSMVLFVDASDIDAPVVVAGALLRRALAAMARQPFRVKPWFAPGPWGGQWMKETFGLSNDQPNYAWSFELIAPENGLLLGGDQPNPVLECSFDMLLWQETDSVLGPRVAARYGSYFPIRFDYLDTMGGTSLSCQVHPRVDYIRDEFGEPFTQDESYYIVTNKPGARVYLGLRDDADLEAFREAAVAARDSGVPFEIDAHVHSLTSAPGDLFLIPSGTVHCSGKDNLVLEISATPYIFTMKIYDYLRTDLRGKLRHVHLDHAFANIDSSRRAHWVDANLVPRPRPLRQGEGWAEYQIGHLDLLFYDVNRLEFAEMIEDDTPAAFVVLNLVEGQLCEVEVAGLPPVELRFAETLIIPASVTHYRLRNRGSSLCKVVKAFVR